MNVKQCFSYIRFSSRKQAKGSSVDRQAPIAEMVAKEKGWRYEPKFNSRDLGISAYKGNNKKTLEQIIELADKGTIPQGSVMILEALDRATRLSLDDAQDLIKKILRSGIEIYTDSSKRHLTKESLNDITSVIITAVELDAAHQYSKKLSNRSVGGFKKLMTKAEKGERVYFGGMMPSFVESVQNGEWVINETRAQVVKRIFTEYLAGASMTGISYQFNREEMPSLSLQTATMWAGNTIRSILINKAYTGDFTYAGKTFKNYIPALVSREDFERVQYLIKQNAFKRGGSKEHILSIFNGTGKCKCGASMIVISSQRRTRRFAYAGCSAARNHKCDTAGHWLHNGALELSFLVEFLMETPFNLINKTTPKFVDTTLHLKMAIAAKEQAINDCVELLGTGIGVAAIKAKMNTLNGELQSLNNELQTAMEQLNRAMGTPQAYTDVKAIFKNSMDDNFVEFDAMWQDVESKLTDVEVRKKLKQIIPHLVKNITIDTVRGGYTVTDYNDETSDFHPVSR